MNNSTCRNECLNYLAMIRSTDNLNIQNELIDKINWTIDNQISRIEHDIKDLEYYIKCKKEDIDIYNWLLNEFEKIKVGNK